MEIPTLDIAMQATELPEPITRWGRISRKAPMPGTYHFYTDDYKMTMLCRRPWMLPATGCRVAVEPNFSTWAGMDRPAATNAIFWKRSLARAWQHAGVRIVVDLNLHEDWRHLAFLGVPRGWRSYATRRHRGFDLDAIEREFAAAAEHAGTADILFFVIGGWKKVRDHCLARGWRRSTGSARGRCPPRHSNSRTSAACPTPDTTARSTAGPPGRPGAPNAAWTCGKAGRAGPTGRSDRAMTDFAFDDGTSFDGHKDGVTPRRKPGRPRKNPPGPPNPPEIGEPLPTPANVPAEIKRHRTLPRSGKYPLRKPKHLATRHKGHAWALSGQWEDIFFESLACCGVITDAAGSANVHPGTIGNRRRADPKFEERFQEAMECFRDGIRREVYHRAIVGREQRTINKKTGEVVSLGNLPDNILLMFAAKYLDHGFRDNQKAEEDKSLAQAVQGTVRAFLQEGFNPRSDDQADAPPLEVFAKTVDLTAIPGPTATETPDEKRARLLRELAELDAQPTEATPPDADD